MTPSFSLSDNTIELPIVLDSNNNPVTAGTISITVNDAFGDPVSGVVWPVPMSHDSGGRWVASFTSSIELFMGMLYRAVIDIDSNGATDQIVKTFSAGVGPALSVKELNNCLWRHS